jgi:hypothetical protein
MQQPATDPLVVAEPLKHMPVSLSLSFFLVRLTSIQPYAEFPIHKDKGGNVKGIFENTKLEDSVKINMRFEILIEVKTSTLAFWVVMPCGFVVPTKRW